MLIAFEGIDAAGKTTVADALAVALRRDGARDVRRVDKTPPASATVRMQRLHDLLWATAEETQGVEGAEFYLFLQAAWCAAYERLEARPALGAGAVLISDVGWGRTVAKAMVREAVPQAWANALFSRLRAPDCVVFLDVEPELAWTRREVFSPWELGRWDAQDGPARDSFCAYQRRIQACLRQLAAAFDWVRVAPAPDWSAERLVQEVRHSISQRLPLPKLVKEGQVP